MLWVPLLPMLWDWGGVIRPISIGLCLTTLSGFLILCLTFWAALIAGGTYWSPTRPNHRLFYLRTPHAQATVTLKPDSRRRANRADSLGSLFAAWPKHHGAGRTLGRHVRDLLDAEGGRITLTATPRMARMYRAEGLVDDGRTALVLPRLASRPNTVEPGERGSPP